jgi:hypothetical protein
MLSRRTMITNSAVARAGGTLLLAELKNATAQQIVNPIDRPRPGTALDTGKPAVDETSLTPAQPDVDYTPVITPNGMSLPWKIVDGVKVFHLIAEEVEHEFAPGLRPSVGVTTDARQVQPLRRQKGTGSGSMSQTASRSRPVFIGMECFFPTGWMALPG